MSVKLSIDELREVTRCRCRPAYKDLGRHDPFCECDSADAVKIVADRIEELEAMLAQAVAALQNIAGKVPYADDPWDIAITTLAELKGETND